MIFWPAWYPSWYAGEDLSTSAVPLHALTIVVISNAATRYPIRFMYSNAPIVVRNAWRMHYSYACLLPCWAQFSAARACIGVVYYVTLVTLTTKVRRVLGRLSSSRDQLVPVCALAQYRDLAVARAPLPRCLLPGGRCSITGTFSGARQDRAT